MNSETTGEKGFDLSRVVLKLEDTDFSRIEGDYWTRFSFRIMQWSNSPQMFSDENLLKLGQLEVLRLNYAISLKSRESLFDIFYSMFSETIDCYEAIFDRNEHLRKPFRDEDSFCVSADLITDLHILNRISIEEQFKGHGITGEASRIYLERFASGYDAYFIKAFPLQFEGDQTRLREDYPRRFKGSFISCQNKLCKYYEQLGFRRIGKSPYFFGTVEDFFLRRRKLKAKSI